MNTRTAWASAFAAYTYTAAITAFIYGEGHTGSILIAAALLEASIRESIRNTRGTGR